MKQWKKVFIFGCLLFTVFTTLTFVIAFTIYDTDEHIVEEERDTTVKPIDPDILARREEFRERVRNTPMFASEKYLNLDNEDTLDRLEHSGLKVRKGETANLFIEENPSTGFMWMHDEASCDV